MFFSHIVAISSLLVLGSAMAGDPEVVLLGGDADARRRQSVHNNCWRPVWCPTDLFSCGNGIVLKRCGFGCNFPMCPVVDIDECVFDWECPAGQSCESGSCTSNVQSCSFNWECPRGQRCRNGRCGNRPGRPNTSMFTCVNGDQIPLSQACNGEFNCSDGSDEWTSHGCQQFSIGRRLENSEIVTEEPTAAEISDFESAVVQPAIQRRTSPMRCSVDWECAPGFECNFGRCEASSSFCSFDWECASGFECRFGRCEVISSSFCSHDWECPAGMSCQSGSCRSNANTCSFDWECASGFECRFGRCEVISSSFCSFDWECGVGMSCRNGSCRSNANTCSFDWECASGFECRFGRCEVISSSFCSFDFECPVGMSCQNGSCTSNANTCSFDWECGRGQSCLNGSCTSPIYCSFNWECPSGQRCGSDGTCRRRGRPRRYWLGGNDDGETGDRNARGRFIAFSNGETGDRKE